MKSSPHLSHVEHLNYNISSTTSLLLENNNSMANSGFIILTFVILK